MNKTCEAGLWGNAQSLKQSSLRCGTRFVSIAPQPSGCSGSNNVENEGAGFGPPFV